MSTAMVSSFLNADSGRVVCSTAQQELEIQINALERANCKRVFSEKISSRIKVRPEFEKALALARDIKQAAPDQPVTLTAHEMKRLARNAAELMACRRPRRPGKHPSVASLYRALAEANSQHAATRP